MRAPALLAEVVAPIAVGAFVYLGLRPAGLVVFDWCDAVGAASAVAALRAVTLPLATAVPEWVRYSLPDALWVYAFTSLLGAVWRWRLTRESAAWIALGPALGIGTELGQLAGVVPGTFDAVDLALVTVAAGVALRRVRLAPRREGASA